MEKCVKTLASSGLASEGDSSPATPSRQNTVPQHEAVITAAETDETGRFLFTSYGGRATKIVALFNQVLITALISYDLVSFFGRS